MVFYTFFILKNEGRMFWGAEIRPRYLTFLINVALIGLSYLIFSTVWSLAENKYLTIAKELFKRVGLAELSDPLTPEDSGSNPVNDNKKPFISY